MAGVKTINSHIGFQYFTTIVGQHIIRALLVAQSPIPTDYNGNLLSKFSLFSGLKN